MSFEDNKTFWEEFIMLYQDQECLWDTKNKEYRSKHQRDEAYNVLIEKCKELFPNADKDFVRKKISSFRSSFRRQVRRLTIAKKNCVKLEDMPETTLWYFDLLFFLLDQEETRQVVQTKEENTYLDEDSKTFEPELCSIEEDPISPDSPENVQLAYGKRNLQATNWENNKRQFVDNSLNNLQDVNVSQTQDFTEPQEFTFGKNVGQQLQEIEMRQKIIAQKLISDVLFHAKLGKLTDYSMISTSINLRIEPQTTLEQLSEMKPDNTY